MNIMKSHMEALVPGIEAAASERARVIREIKDQTANMLRAFGRERVAMVKALKSNLASDRVNRSLEVLALRQDTHKMCDGFQKNHSQMRRVLHKSLVRSRQGIVSYVATLRSEFSRQFRNFSKVQHAGLTKDHRARSHVVSDLVNSFHTSRAVMAKELADSLMQSTQDIKAQVSELRWPTAEPARTFASPAVVLAGHSNLSIKPATASFAWPVASPEIKPEHGPSVLHHDKTAMAEASWQNVNKSVKPKKK